MPQSLSQVWVHIIFSTKERYPFLKELDVQRRLYDYIKGICYKHKCNVMTIGGFEDHIHLLVNVDKNISLSSLVEEIKKSSSRWMKKLSTARETFDSFYWQNGYGAFSVSQSNIECVRHYIQNQYRHHQTQDFKTELRKFLSHHGMDYNEKYLWD